MSGLCRRRCDLVIFSHMGALNAWRPRFWCRYLCPLGASWVIFSHAASFTAQRQVRQLATNATLCGMSCHGAAAINSGGTWIPWNASGAWDCSESCRRESLRFQFVLPGAKEQKVKSVDLSSARHDGGRGRRLVTLAAMRISPQARGKTFNPYLDRPPGARPERDFLQKCTSCGLCIRSPDGRLQPTLERGRPGGPLDSGCSCPRSATAIMCNLCGQVCPTEAIVR